MNKTNKIMLYVMPQGRNLYIENNSIILENKAMGRVTIGKISDKRKALMRPFWYISAGTCASDNYSIMQALKESKELKP